MPYSCIFNYSFLSL